MRAVDGAERFRVSVVSHGYPQGVDEQPPMQVNVDLGLRWLPDLTDPATLGCLLALVREGWRSPLIHPRAAGCEWRMWKTEPYAYAYETEEEALVAALESAP